jgi:hypothetical protein
VQQWGMIMWFSMTIYNFLIKKWPTKSS